MGAALLCIAMVSFIVYCVMDRKEDKAAAATANQEEEQFKFSDLKLLFTNRGFWYITVLCLMFYAGVFPFLKFATKLMVIKYGVSEDLAGAIPSMLPYGTIILTPLFGYIYDRIGKGATLMIIGSVLGIVFLLLRIRLPAVVEKAVSNLGSIATPLQLFLLGAFFRFSGLRRYVRPLTVVTLVKLFVTPAIMLSAAALLGIRGVEFLGLIGIFASPTAINSFTMVQQMKCGDAELAGDIVVMTSAVSIFSFFIWIYLFKSLGMF